MAANIKPVPLCCVRIGYEYFLMPTDKGMKLLDLMQSAVKCERDYKTGRTYEAGIQPEIELTTVKPNQVVWPSIEDSDTTPRPQVKRLTRS